MNEGLVNILKPPGMTSSDVVADVRKIFAMKRVGHTGTLDPGAAGVLGICLGRATRFFDLLVDKKKEYICEICFGISTDTQDSYGKITEEAETSVSEDMLLSVLPSFRGDISQMAPMYSALKVNGKAMYAHARQGQSVEPRYRQASIYELELLEKSGDNRYLLKILCGKGTYVRTICYDIGRALGVPAHMSFLLRTRSGELRVENAYTIQELSEMREAGTLEQAVIAPDESLAFLPAFSPENMSQRQKRLLLNGAEIPAEAPDGQARVYIDGEFVGVGEIQNGYIHIGISFLRTED